MQKSFEKPAIRVVNMGVVGWIPPVLNSITIFRNWVDEVMVQQLCMSLEPRPRRVPKIELGLTLQIRNSSPGSKIVLR
jgi:hypothetical protein